MIIYPPPHGKLNLPRVERMRLQLPEKSKLKEGVNYNLNFVESKHSKYRAGQL